MWQQLLSDLQQGNTRALARSISFVENGQEGYEQLLQHLPPGTGTKIIGLTGPPGAGKSTLADALIGAMLQAGKRLAVLCVDPSSPFNRGAVLGDRIRMSEWYTHPSVYIRSLASRGSVGGLHPRIIEITEVVKAAAFDYLLIETVGVGQSEIEIAGLADCTVVVLVPEAGDEVQTMKAGLMEIADIFVVNKSDRPGAGAMEKSLRSMLAGTFVHHQHEVPIIQTVAAQRKGINDLYEALQTVLQNSQHPNWKFRLLAERAYRLIQQQRMQDVSLPLILENITQEAPMPTFNLYKFAATYFK